MYTSTEVYMVIETMLTHTYDNSGTNIDFSS